MMGSMASMFKNGGAVKGALLETDADATGEGLMVLISDDDDGSMVTCGDLMVVDRGSRGLVAGAAASRVGAAVAADLGAQTSKDDQYASSAIEVINTLLPASDSHTIITVCNIGGFK